MEFLLLCGILLVAAIVTYVWIQYQDSKESHS